MKVLVCAATTYRAASEIAQALADVLAAKGLVGSVVRVVDGRPGQRNAGWCDGNA